MGVSQGGIAAMADPKVVHSTYVVERSFAKPVEAVYAALSKPEKVKAWYAEGEKHDLIEFTLNFMEGGTQRLVYRMREGTPVAGLVIDSEARFQEIVPNDRVVMATTMKFNGRRMLATQITFELVPTPQGTDLICTHQGAYFEGSPANMPDMLRQGWTDLLARMGKLLEAE
ncbi:polyketide cyclase [Acidobacteria bacterium AB60]|nr:polyketide cyclase [Acidobacteria bacterium AB60]